ncbi:hypothetical protein A1Q1_02515 [Trichosporon asahii var. asahii CBS 2479]|uniref:Uncharacterized protein n=1 Tax=Trichosporon asahii var. asahii (strain ATCC 90039 / CBS 2479 / JCM 2466 / KCTC 7840 / NBRC 103889/ NCYC 2677 / UAMH 7654) TaxID=1186058 RepID=J6EV95_TRIAS|nr:hypothetical protein A1Q1_02515 [Trichosporon asahii var. asahii CBS 2479]EJT48494.1 hypothetical protein A1Q1_02515 [Trichosporon asahii var. asahii CBS 2479]
MWTPLALLALVAPALAVPCGKNFTITSANKGDACLGATYDSGFATVSKCNGSPGQTWMWDGLKIYNYVGPANNRACLTFSPSVVLDLRDGKTDGGVAQVYRQTPGNTNQKWILKAI